MILVTAALFHFIMAKQLLVDLNGFVASLVIVFVLYLCVKWVAILPWAGFVFPIPSTVNQTPATIIATVFVVACCGILWFKRKSSGNA